MKTLILPINNDVGNVHVHCTYLICIFLDPVTSNDLDRGMVFYKHLLFFYQTYVPPDNCDSHYLLLTIVMLTLVSAQIISRSTPKSFLDHFQDFFFFISVGHILVDISKLHTARYIKNVPF